MSLTQNTTQFAKSILGFVHAALKLYTIPLHPVIRCLKKVIAHVVSDGKGYLMPSSIADLHCPPNFSFLLQRCYQSGLPSANWPCRVIPQKPKVFQRVQVYLEKRCFCFGIGSADCRGHLPFRVGRATLRQSRQPEGGTAKIETRRCFHASHRCLISTVTTEDLG